jgi:integrase
VVEHLTDAKIKTLPLPGSRRELPDEKVGGLYLVAQPSGAKSWAVRYRHLGAPRKYTIGPYPAIGLGEARKLAQEALGEVARGNDPAARKQAARAAAVAKAAIDDHVETVVDDFIRLYAKKNTRDWKETERLLKKDIVKAWAGKRIGDIGKKHVVKLLDDIVERGAPVGANRAFAQLRKMCSWAVSRGIIDRSPCEGVEPPSAETERDRVLSDEELALIWRAAGELGFPFGPIVRLLVATGQRRSEVAGMRWSEVDIKEAIWTIPKERAKNGREHQVPLTPTTISLLETLPRFKGSGFVFSAGQTSPSGYSVAKKRLDREIANLNDGAPTAAWTLHDIRRSVATKLAELKTAPHTVEALLNHVSGVISGIARIYNKYSYWPEKRAALRAWGRYLDALVAGGNVWSRHLDELREEEKHKELDIFHASLLQNDEVWKRYFDGVISGAPAGNVVELASVRG